MIGAAIKKAFEPTEKSDEDWILQQSEIDCKIGPQVTHFKQKRASMDHGKQPRGEGLKHLRRCTDDHIGPWLRCPNGKRGDHERQKRENARSKSTAGGRVRWRATHDDSIFDAARCRLFLQEASAGLVADTTRDHREGMAIGNKAPA